MVNMLESTKLFFEKNLPVALTLGTGTEVLELLYDLIEDKGFAPPDYYDYNNFGREAQLPYDDIYLSNP